MSELKTALYEHHVSLHAKMAPFGGFVMPIQYTSVIEEVNAVRKDVGMFDVSHMGEFFVEGADAVHFVDYAITNDFLSAEIGKAVYSPLCRDDGTLIDDLIVYKLSKTKVMICVNASNIKKDWDWLSVVILKFNCQLSNRSDDYSLIAIQGPNSEAILRSVGLLKDSIDLKYYSILCLDDQIEKLIIARTGYTGEDGFEIFCGHAFAKILWGKLISMNVKPCGLAARDVLRLEVCYPLFGHELVDHLTPLDSNVRWTVKIKKPMFIGKNSLVNYVPRFKLINLELEKGIPREGYEVYNSENISVGVVTSGTMSVVLNKGIAMAFVSTNAKLDSLKVKIRNQYYEAKIVEGSFYKGRHK